MVKSVSVAGTIRRGWEKRRNSRRCANDASRHWKRSKRRDSGFAAGLCCGRRQLMTQINKSRLAWRTLYLAAALGIYLMDQASKAWALRRVRFADRTVIRDGLDCD